MLKLILIVATITRILWLPHLPASLNWDEISMGVSAHSILETGRDEWGSQLPILFRSYGEWKSAVYIYLLVPFIKVIGLNAWAVRLPSALAGILAVYLSYLIGKKIYNEKIGLWAAFFLAVSPWHLLLSRPAFEANVSLTLILAGVYFFLRSSPISHYPSIIYSAILFGLAPHTYNSAKVVVPFLVLYLVFSTRLYQRLKDLLIFLGILLLFATPILLNLFSGRAQYRYSQVGVTTDLKGLNEFIDTRRTFPMPPLVNKLSFNRGTYFIRQTIGNYLAYFDPSFLVWEAGDHNQHHLKFFGVLYKVEFVFALLGLVTLFSRNSSSLTHYPLIIIFLGFLPAAMTRDSHHVLRSILTLPGWQLLAALGLIQAQKTFKPIIHYALCLILIFEISIFLLTYFTWYPKAFARDWQAGYSEVATYLQTHESEYDRIVMTKWYGEPQLFLAFYNRWDPLWYQAENQQNIRYETEGKIWLDQLSEYAIGKYTFKYINWQDEDKTPRTLFIGKWDDFYPDSNIVKTIYFPDNSIAFLLVET